MFNIKSKIVLFIFIVSIVVAGMTAVFIDSSIMGSDGILGYNLGILPFFVLLFFFVLIASLVFSFNLLRPVNQLIIATQLIGEGKYEQRLRKKGSDEFARLINSFNSMSRKLKRYIDQSTHYSDMAAREKCKSDRIIDSMAEGVIVADENYNIVMFNSAAEELFSMPEEKAQNLHLIHFFQRYGMDDLIEKYPTIDKEGLLPVRNPNATIIEAAMEKPSKRILRFTISPVLNDRKFAVGTVAVIADVTKIKEIDRMKSDFVSTVSHELRTPLTSILGYTSIMLSGKMGGFNERQKNSLEVVDRESKRLSALIEDILDLSKLESGKAKLKLEETSLIDLLDSSPALGLAEKKGIKLEIIRPKNLPPVKVDKMKIAQVFTNLISNAVKFTKQGGKIRIKFSNKKHFVSVEIADNGIGIRKDQIPKLFSKFYQAHSHLTRQQSGTGLGLSIVKEIIGLHRGLIGVKSSYGKGTSITFLLPKVDFSNSTESVKCWEVKDCEKTRCPAYKSYDDRCWLQPGTMCKKGSKEMCFDKTDICFYCDIYRKELDFGDGEDGS